MDYEARLRWIASRYEIPKRITDDFVRSICAKRGTLERIWGLCTRDLSDCDFPEASPEMLFNLAFNGLTKWPESLTKYDYLQVLEQGKRAGLSVEKLHQQGISGVGVNLAVIDKPLLTTHREFANRLRAYINLCEDLDEQFSEPDFHGITCAGFACGNDVGVANGAGLYYYAGPDMANFGYWPYYLNALEQILAHNRAHDDKISIVSISAGIPNEPTEIRQRFDRLSGLLADNGCYVITSDIFGMDFVSASRVYGCDVDDYDAYKLDETWQTPGWVKNRILVPAGGRTSPCNRGVNEYKFNGNGNSFSWAIPYIAGVFALALQVDRDLSYASFCTLAKETAVLNSRQLNVLSPATIIERLFDRSKTNIV